MSDTTTPTMATPTHRVLVATRDGLRAPGAGTERLAGVALDAVHAAGGRTWVLAEHRRLHRLDGDADSDAAGAGDRASEPVAELPSGAVGGCVLAHHDHVFVGGDDAGLWRFDGSEVGAVASFATAPTRDAWYTPWGGPPSVLSMAAHGDDLYVGVHVGGILRTADAGASWTPTIDLEVDVHQVAVDPEGGVWVATGAAGLAHSVDRGATWRFHTDGLHATYLLTVAVTTDGVLVGASSGHAGRDGALYRFDGDRFERLAAGLPADLGGAVSPRHLAATGDDAVVALPGGDVYASADAGRTWARVARGLPGVAEVSVSA